MRVKYLAMLATVSVLSVGVATSCSKPPSSTETATTNTAVETKANPCAAKANPCAAKANPCAAKANPCAAKANPCAAKANPCAAKDTSKASVGGPLSQELQGKPVVVDIFATWCSACKNIAPTLSQLRQEYGDRANFVVLDVSDKSTTSQSESQARQLGLSKFFAANKSKTGMVAIIDPATGTILTEYKNNPDKAAYTKVLDTALAKK